VADNYMLSWGLHPEDVAAEKVELGAAILFSPGDFAEKEDDGSQKLLISYPTKQMECWITSANARELEINSYEAFREHVKLLKIQETSVKN